MTEQELIEECFNLAWENAGRVLLVAILGMFGLLLLQLLSLHSEAFTQADLERINWVFGVLGGLMIAYVGLPFFRFGIEHKDTRFGKAMSVGVPAVVIVAYLV